MQTETFNPYSAPASPPDESRLAAETEFLFNDKVVAGIGTITLPKICVVSGSRQDLVSRVNRLSWCSRWITWPRNAAFCSVISYVPPLLSFGGVAPNANWYRLIAAGILSIAAFASIISVLLRSSVTVHWSLSRKLHKRHQWLWSLLTVFCALICIGMLRLLATPSGGILAVNPGLIVIIGCVSLIRGKRVLFVAGRHEGLFLIGGLSDKFLTETKRMADEHAARIGE